MIRRTGIPTNSRVETFRATSSVVAHRDIVQSSVTRLVQPWVQEAQRRFAGTQTRVIEHGNERGKGGRGTGRASDVTCFTLVDNKEVPRLRSDVGNALYGRRD